MSSLNDFRKNPIVAATIAAIIAVSAISAAGEVFADPSPNGPGQPGAPQTTCGSSDLTSETPPSSSANGSPFNPSGTSGTVYAGNPGTQSLANANSPKAVSQYDIACFELTQH